MYSLACPKRSPLPRSLLTARAIGIRSRPTWSELTLWESVRASKLGTEFRRQVPIAGKFIVDFLAPRCRLVVEIDGPYHARRIQADSRRDKALARLGYRVLRLQADLVEQDLEAAVAQIRAELGRCSR